MAFFRRDGFTVQSYEVLELREWTPNHPKDVPRSDQWTVRGVNVEMRFEGADPACLPEPVGEPQGIYNYLLGNDSSAWVRDVPVYTGIRYRDLWEGIDLEVELQGGHLRHLLRYETEADIERIAFDVNGADSLVPDSEGPWHARTERGMLAMGRFMTAPIAKLDAGGEWSEPDPQSFPSTGGPSLGTWPEYSTYLGGEGSDRGQGVDLHQPPNGNARTFVAGVTTSATFLPSFPAGSFDLTLDGIYDAFVLKIKGTGTGFRWATYLGGDDDDSANDIAVDPSGQAYVTGHTNSLDFPTAGLTTSLSVDPTCDPLVENCQRFDAFVTKLEFNGSALLYSRYVGGYGDDLAWGVDIDSLGRTSFTGETDSTNYPVVGAPVSSTQQFGQDLNGTGSGTDSDAMVTRLDSSGNIQYSVYLSDNQGGAATDIGLGIYLNQNDENEAVTHVAVTTLSDTMPIVNSPGGPGFGVGYPNVTDSYLASINEGTGDLYQGTFVCQPGNDGAIGVTARGETLWWCGFSEGPVLNPTGSPSTYDWTYNGSANCVSTSPYPGDAVIGRLFWVVSNPPEFITFLGGSNCDAAFDIALRDPYCNSTDTFGNCTDQVVYVTGTTASANFPTTTGAFDESFNRASDVFIAVLDTEPYTSTNPEDRLLSSTFVGGTKEEAGLSIVINPANDWAFVTGVTRSSNFPIHPLGLDQSYAGTDEGFVVHVSMP